MFGRLPIRSSSHPNTGTRHVTTAHMTESADETPAIQLRYDPSVDMGYLRLGSHRYWGMSKTTRMWWDDDLRVELGLDFDADGRLIGIELFSVSRIVTPDVLKAAHRYDPS